MKIVFATDVIKYPLTGIGRYTIELINQLQQAPKIAQLRYFRGLRVYNTFSRHIRRPSASNNILTNSIKRHMLLIEAFRAIYPKLQKQVLRPYKNFIYHSPNYYLPTGLPRAITTFHDISVFTVPEFHPSWRVRYLAQEMIASLTRANRIITVSEFSKKELVKYFNYPISKVDVTHLACSEDFYPRAAPVVGPLMQRLGLSAQGYSLFTGTIEPRKNLTVLLNAYEQIPKALRQRYPLVITGYTGWGSGIEYQNFERISRAGWGKYLGYITQEELPILFAAARLFIFPSLYEGFGLPVLEAMASGVPVVCSNAASLPEVVGDAAFTCEPRDVDALSKGIEYGLQDETWRAQARAAGLANAQKFSWHSCAQDTIEAYLKI